MKMIMIIIKIILHFFQFFSFVKIERKKSNLFYFLKQSTVHARYVKSVLVSSTVHARYVKSVHVSKNNIFYIKSITRKFSLYNYVRAVLHTHFIIDALNVKIKQCIPAILYAIKHCKQQRKYTFKH